MAELRKLQPSLSVWLGDSGIQKIPERNATSREQRPQWGVHGRREGGVGGERPIWLWITLVPSGSPANLESIKVLGSALAHLGGNGASPPGSAVASALPWRSTASQQRPSVLGTGTFCGLRSAWTWRLLQGEGKGRLEACSTSVKKRGKGQEQSSHLPSKRHNVW